MAEAGETLGGIDIVIGNVSALAVADHEETGKAGFETDMMHLVGLVNAAMPWLEKSSDASITLVSSVSGREIDFTGPAYGAFKAAILHYAHGLACKMAGQGIRANSVSPGNTYFEGGDLAEYRDQHAGPVRAGAGDEPDGADGEAGGDRARRGVPREPRFELHDRDQSGDRRGADKRCAALRGSGLPDMHAHSTSVSRWGWRR